MRVRNGVITGKSSSVHLEDAYIYFAPSNYACLGIRYVIELTLFLCQHTGENRLLMQFCR
jgi:hypothetical protein